VPAGKATADAVAARHGFVNLGQIGSLENHFLLEHPRISKRSTDPSPEHHDRIGADADVAWFEQQGPI
jgi:proprotein convertase subtilisin/kexin type 5